MHHQREPLLFEFVLFVILCDTVHLRILMRGAQCAPLQHVCAECVYGIRFNSQSD